MNKVASKADVGQRNPHTHGQEPVHKACTQHTHTYIYTTIYTHIYIYTQIEGLLNKLVGDKGVMIKLVAMVPLYSYTTHVSSDPLHLDYIFFFACTSVSLLTGKDEPGHGESPQRAMEPLIHSMTW